MGKEKLAVVLASRRVEVSASTVGRCLAELMARGVVEVIGAARRRRRAQRLAAARSWARRKRGERPLSPGELVQVDTLHERSLDRPRFQFTAVDPVTRFAHAQLYPSPSSVNARAFLEELITVLPFPLRSVQVDNGGEFRGAFEAACAELSIPVYTIPPRAPKANAKVERLQRTFRDEHYAFEPPSLTLEERRQALGAYLHPYNHHRPHKALDYQAPAAYGRARNLCLK
jgi:transposase InsO family protein